MASKIVFEKFDSLQEYVRTIGGRSVNSVFSGQDLSSQKAGSSDFANTATYEDSVALIERGDSEGLEKMVDVINDIKYTAKSSRSIPTSSPVGFAPIVPNAILGLPNSMISKKVVQMKSKIISIMYDATASCGISSKDMAIAGRNILDLIYGLEVKGYRVELFACISMCTKEEVAIASVKVKTDKQPMNPLKIAYPILHASFLRRQGFKWLETSPAVMSKGFLGGYGTPLYHHIGSDISERRKFLRKEKVLPDGVFYTEFYEAKKNGAQKLMEIMGIK